VNPEEREYILSGERHFNAGDYNRAIEEFSKALAITENEARIRNNIGLAYVKRGFFEKALEEFKQALKADPSHEKTKFNLGIAVCEQSKKYIDNKKPDSAINILKEVSNLIPEHPLPCSSLGIIYSLQDKKDEALVLLNKALELCNSEAYGSIKKSIEKEIKKLEGTTS